MEFQERKIGRNNFGRGNFLLQKKQRKYEVNISKITKCRRKSNNKKSAWKKNSKM